MKLKIYFDSLEVELVIQENQLFVLQGGGE